MIMKIAKNWDEEHSDPSVRSDGMIAMVMFDFSKSWLTMVPLSRSWQVMARFRQNTHGLSCFLSRISFQKL